MEIERFKKMPVLGILRGAELDVLDQVIETAVASRLEAIEITMNTPGAVALIAQARRVARGRIAVGAGTVLSLPQMEQALKAGASFIVSPVLIPEIVRNCVKGSIPVFPGALTPAEVYAAWTSGATMVKVFPVSVFGPGYFKELLGPLADIQLLACGGVTAENVAQYMASGSKAVAFGSSVFKKEWLQQKCFEKIAQGIRGFTSFFSKSA